MEFVKLNTDRMVLREFQTEDLTFVYNHFSDPRISKYLFDADPPGTIDDARELLNWCLDTHSNHLRWCMVSKDKNAPIGTCGFHCYDRRNNAAEIGYDLSFEKWNNGYMTEALSKLLSHGFNAGSLHRIYAYVYVHNDASNQLLQKLGFKLEGVIRDKHLYHGRYYDHNLFSLLCGEWIS